MSILRNIKTSRVLLHTLFWMLSMVTFAFIFRIAEAISKPDLIYSILFHAAIMVCVYLNFWGIKRWLTSNNYLTYSTFVLGSLAIAIILNQYTFNVFVDLILPDYYFVSQFNNIEIGIILFLYLILTSAIKLSKSWFDVQRMKQQMVEKEKEKIDGELQNLKAQINPHFLFNSLNVIYSLTLNNDEATSAVVLKLSDILRYVIYDSRQDKVSLSSEIALLKKYIDLQKYRVESGTPISFISNIEKDVEIAPLLFLTLVENSFKHGLKSDTENVFVAIKLTSNAQKVHFVIENNKSTINADNPKGVGLENIKKRLLLQYPDKHRLKVSDNEKTFKVELEIDHES